jgi:hypothetical protein
MTLLESFFFRGKIPSDQFCYTAMPALITARAGSRRCA